MAKAFKCTKGEIGISSMVIMLASLLIVGMLAGLYLYSTHKLETDALKNVEKTKNKVASKLSISEITSVYEGNSTIKNMTALVRLEPGSDNIDLNDLTITIKTDYSQATLKYRGGSVFERDVTSGYYTNCSDGSGYFVVDYLKRSDRHQEGFLFRGELIKVYFELRDYLGTGETATIRLVPKVGSETVAMFTTPDSAGVGKVYLSHY